MVPAESSCPPPQSGEHIPTVTIHSDMGCDSYANSIPAHAGDGVTDLTCHTPEEEKRTAQRDAAWWRATLGPHYRGFFDAHDYPKDNFRKIMHIHVTDALIKRCALAPPRLPCSALPPCCAPLTTLRSPRSAPTAATRLLRRAWPRRYKEVRFVWAHLGLSMELTTLHPAVHAHILRTFYERHATNLWSDMSWDVLAKVSHKLPTREASDPRKPALPRAAVACLCRTSRR